MEHGGKSKEFFINAIPVKAGISGSIEN